HISATPLSLVAARHAAARDLHAFPTRRSSDLQRLANPAMPARISRLSICLIIYNPPVPIGGSSLLRNLVLDARHVYCFFLLFFRSEEHTSELQSRENLVCRLLLEKKKKSEEAH